jgi:DNA primase
MNDPVLQAIKDRLNIVDVISGYLQLKKAGVNFKTPCPFHSEKSASFIVSPQKQIWHCFGCGEGGDVFSFIKRIENLEFKDALKILADKAGVKLSSYRPENKQVQDEKELLLRINDFTSRFYHQVLLKETLGKNASEYLKKRGLSLETIKKWQIGFAPNEFHILEKALLVKKVSFENMVKAGVCAKNERGQIYDRFRGRITFPIFNYLGEVVGFSARILPELDDGKMGKYINSPETVVYKKSEILFGLNFAKDTIRKKDEVVVVEGQMDCIAAHQSGFFNTVASSGTALTQLQLNLVGRLTKNLKFCFDSDTAGQNASRKAGELSLANGFRIKIIELKAVKDPDELLKKSPGLWEKAVKEAVWFLDHYISLAENSFSKDAVEQKHYLTSQVIPLLGFIKDPLEQDHYVKRLVNKFGISEKVILGEIKKQQKPNTQIKEVNAKDGPPNLLLEKLVLGGALYSSSFLAKILVEAEILDFTVSEIAELFRPVLSKLSNTIDQSSGVAKEALFMVELQLEEYANDTERLDKDLQKAFALLKIHSIKRQLQILILEIKQAENNKDTTKVTQLQKKFADLSLSRMKYDS